jgi:hypothetical protein
MPLKKESSEPDTFESLMAQFSGKADGDFYIRFAALLKDSRKTKAVQLDAPCRTLEISATPSYDTDPALSRPRAPRRVPTVDDPIPDVERQSMNPFRIVAFVIGTFCDGLTTLIGLVFVLKTKEPIGYLIAGGLTLFVVGLSLSTREIFQGRRAIDYCLRFLWVFAFLFDLLTSFIGSLNYFSFGKVNPTEGLVNLGQIIVALKAVEPMQLALICLFTFGFSLSPIALSFLMNHQKHIRREGSSSFW